VGKLKIAICLILLALTESLISNANTEYIKKDSTRTLIDIGNDEKITRQLFNSLSINYKPISIPFDSIIASHKLPKPQYYGYYKKP